MLTCFNPHIPCFGHKVWASIPGYWPPAASGETRLAFYWTEQPNDRLIFTTISSWFDNLSFCLNWKLSFFDFFKKNNDVNKIKFINFICVRACKLDIQTVHEWHTCRREITLSCFWLHYCVGSSIAVESDLGMYCGKWGGYSHDPMFYMVHKAKCFTRYHVKHMEW